MSAESLRQLHVEVERGAEETAALRALVERKRAELSVLRMRVGAYEPLDLRFVRVATVAVLLLTVLQVLVALSVERAATYMARDVARTHAAALLRVDVAERIASVEDACFKGREPERARLRVIVDSAGELRDIELTPTTRVTAACAETVLRAGGFPPLPPDGAAVTVEATFLPARPVR